MGAHTPGPWHVKGTYIEDLCGCYVADVKLDDEDPEPAANARLIAAAPELLRALENLMDVAGEYVSKANWAMSEARAAIAKATGDE